MRLMVPINYLKFDCHGESSESARSWDAAGQVSQIHGQFVEGVGSWVEMTVRMGFPLKWESHGNAVGMGQTLSQLYEETWMEWE